MKVLCTGAGGALGGHLTKRLLADGHEVRAVDVKPRDDWWQWHPEAENFALRDLSKIHECETMVDEQEWVFNLAANMGGIGFITQKEADCIFTVVMTANMVKAAAQEGVQRFLQTSSACVYPTSLQTDADASPALREDQAWPALPDHGYGLEKLFGEKLCEYASDWGLQTRVARLHNVYGPNGEWQGGREKAPAAICRKVAEAKLGGLDHIDVWGDGKQARSYCYVGDFVEGVIRIMESDYASPVNLGSEELVTVDELITIAEQAAGIEPLKRVYDLDAPQGVRGRNSDNTLIRAQIGWEPQTSLTEGIGVLFPWVQEQVKNAQG